MYHPGAKSEGTPAASPSDGETPGDAAQLEAAEAEAQSQGASLAEAEPDAPVAIEPPPINQVPRLALHF